jgi:Helix-turn-helix domain/Domain of unknown function (DUF4115)
VGEFGDKFRKARENKSLTLDDVSNVTKISARMLQAIEEEKFDQLPGGVFNKGFIRAYARHLGVNDEDAVTEYLACLRRAQVEAQAVWEPPSHVMTQVKRPAVASVVQTAKAPSPVHSDDLPEMQLPRAEHVRPPREKFVEKRDRAPNWRLLAVAVVVLLLLVVLRRRHSGVDAQVTQPAQAAPIATVAANNPPPAQPSGSSSSRSVSSAVGPTSTPINPGPHVASAGGPAQSNPSQSKPTSGLAATGADQKSAGVKDETKASAKPADDSTIVKQESDVTMRSFGLGSAAAAASSTKSAAPLMLIIRATENSWVSISADGKTASHETLIAPAATSVRANREIVAKIGNAAGVTFLWNGQEIQAQGAESEVKTFVFDANGMRVVEASPAQ